TELGEMCHQVAIIEQGQLLAVGSVAEIRRGHQPEAHSQVRVELLGPAEEAAKWLRTRADSPEPGPFRGVGEIKVEGNTLVFPHPSDRGTEGMMLRELVLAGVPVVAFGSHETSLEEVFMKVTEGQASQ